GVDHLSSMTPQDQLFAPGALAVRMPYAHAMVPRGRHDALSIGAECNRYDGVFVARENDCLALAVRGHDPRRLVAARSRHARAVGAPHGGKDRPAVPLEENR